MWLTPVPVYKEWGVTLVGSRRTQKFTTAYRAADVALDFALRGWGCIVTSKGVGRMIAEIHPARNGVITYTAHPAHHVAEVAELREVLDARGAVDAAQSRPQPGT